MLILIIFLCLQLRCVISTVCPPQFGNSAVGPYTNPSPLAFMDTPQLLQFYNYPVEVFDVETEDGYILTIFRIPRGKRAPEPPSRGPILVQHGLVSSSDDWLLVTEDSILPFLLSDQGYDVWLGNFRGNRYGQKHATLSSDDLEFWDFSFHEMAKFDLPAMIKFVLGHSGTKTMDYVGHSMGTTTFFIAMDIRPELQGKIKRMVALSPVAYLKNVKTPMSFLSRAPSFALTALFDNISNGRILFDYLSRWLARYGPYICSNDILTCLCQDVVFFITGYDPSQTSEFTLSVISGHVPDDCSGKALIHYLQWVKVERFQQYDYGSRINLARYGQTQPPKYNLSTNHVDTLVMYADNDWLVQPTDAERAIRELGNATPLKVNHTDFNHMDFLFAKDVRSLCYDFAVDFFVS